MAVHQRADLWFALLDGVVIGEGGTLGPADEQGTIEIGYGFAEPYEGCGYEADLSAGLRAALVRLPGVVKVVDVMTAGSGDHTPPSVDGTDSDTLLAFIDYLRTCVIAKVDDSPTKTRVLLSGHADILREQLDGVVGR
jgi:hypothetical protein